MWRFRTGVLLAAVIVLGGCASKNTSPVTAPVERSGPTAEERAASNHADESEARRQRRLYEDERCRLRFGPQAVASHPDTWSGTRGVGVANPDGSGERIECRLPDPAEAERQARNNATDRANDLAAKQRCTDGISSGDWYWDTSRNTDPDRPDQGVCLLAGA